MAGIDPSRFLTADPLERRVLERVSLRAWDLADERNDALALKIRNQIAEMWNG